MSDWILLRGLTRETRHWGAFEQAMRAHGLLDANDRVVCFDLPGNGVEHARRSPSSVRAMTGFVRERVASLNVRLPCRVLAMSLGAMVAADWAQQHPGEIARLVLVNTSMRPFASMRERLRPAAWPMLVRIAAQWTRAGKCEHSIHALTCHRSNMKARDVACWSEWRRTHGASAANALRQLWAAARFRARNEAPACSVLLLASTNDRLVDHACSARIAAGWRTAFAVHPWAGHDLPHDDAGWTCRAIAAWLVEQERSSVRVTAQSPIDRQNESVHRRY